MTDNTVEHNCKMDPLNTLIIVSRRMFSNVGTTISDTFICLFLPGISFFFCQFSCFLPVAGYETDSCSTDHLQAGVRQDLPEQRIVEQACQDLTDLVAHPVVHGKQTVKLGRRKARRTGLGAVTVVIACRAGELLDLGSGNGYPALPLVAARPGLRPLLVEASSRKAPFFLFISTTLAYWWAAP